MDFKEPVDLGYKIHLIDGFDLGFPSRTGSYIFNEETLTIIETGPSRSVPHILQGLKALGRRPEEVQYIIVTHIHLDHAGGAGLLLKECPQAKVVVHPRGFRHLINPERLIAGAKAVYGEAFEELFAPILPIQEDRLLQMADGETLQISEERTFTFLDSPGHAKHHFSIYDPYSNGIFTGDTIGVRYAGLEAFGGDIFLPSTSPNQFDPNAMLDSLEKIKQLNIDKIYFGHYGVTTQPTLVFSEIPVWLDRFMEEGRRQYSLGHNPQDLAKALKTMVTKDFSETRSIPEDHNFYKMMALDMQVCAMGIFDYLSKQSV